MKKDWTSCDECADLQCAFLCVAIRTRRNHTSLCTLTVSLQCLDVWGDMNLRTHIGLVHVC